jgi:hypothetical protein
MTCKICITEQENLNVIALKIQKQVLSVFFSIKLHLTFNHNTSCIKLVL